jgi:pyruvate,water dikinase
MMDLLRRLLGKNRWKPVEVPKDRRALLNLKYMLFKEITTSNDEVLDVIADIEKKLEGESFIGMAYIRSRCVTAAAHTYRMVQNINKLSNRRHLDLHNVFSNLQRSVEAVLDHALRRAEGPLARPLGEVDLSDLDAVGGKSANLGELKNRALLPVPEGFAITTEAFLRFMEENHLSEEIRGLQVSLAAGDSGEVDELSRAIQETILRAPVSPDLAAPILGAYDALCSSMGFAPKISVRSSAVGEDGELSFAGQYLSVLNVTREGILDAYREVIASLYTPRAIFYRSIRGILDEDVPMGVACVSMVEASASGVACSVDPNRPSSGCILINGSWGLGVETVGGEVAPDYWEVRKGPEMEIVRSLAGSKETRMEPVGSGGVGRVPVPPALRSVLCLSDAQVRDLAAMVVAAEAHYGRPQEVEWALDGSGRLSLLQSRPLRTSASDLSRAEPPPPEVEGHPLLLGGIPASSGRGAGPVFLAAVPEDLASFPSGAVLVARTSSPQLVKVMDRACAIVTDVGGPTGHMASLAREFGVPAVLGTGEATGKLSAGRVVTVDGDRGGIYDGRVDGLLESRPPLPLRRMRGTPIFGILEEASAHIAPLNLTDPRAADFRADGCRTFHDIARFVHEKAFEEMFHISDRLADVEFQAVRLKEKLPFEVYLIDMGGGLRMERPQPFVLPDAVVSVPLRALLGGMTHPGLQWWVPRHINLPGFITVAAGSLLSPPHREGERTIGDKSYAIVADAYCNFSSRIGYHFAAVDSYICDTASRNYISFRFKGGAADESRRVKRCQLIGEILKRLDFLVDRRGDHVNARLRKFDREPMVSRLDQIGRLIVATRQLDMHMGPQSSIGEYVEYFFRENYLFEPGR